MSTEAERGELKRWRPPWSRPAQRRSPALEPVEESAGPMPQSHVQEHIELIAKHEEDFLAQRTAGERIGDAIAGFAGSFGFVTLHLLLFFGWIGWNTLARGRQFDPFPFPMLDTVVALEAILLASFILMRQARTARRAEERDHLMLQILLLTEKEITAVLGVDRQIARQVGLDKVANNAEIRELSQQTSIEDVAQTIKESIPTTAAE